MTEVQFFKGIHDTFRGSLPVGHSHSDSHGIAIWGVVSTAFRQVRSGCACAIEGSHCQETMPSESGNAPWAVMRVSCVTWLTVPLHPLVEKKCLICFPASKQIRMKVTWSRGYKYFSKRVAQHSSNLHESLNALVNVEPVASPSYTEWLIRRAARTT